MSTFSENQHLTRQLDLIPLEVLDVPINIIGAGAIGSFTALSLAKMGYSNIRVFDDDTIDVENMNCQFFRFSDIGKQKVIALKELIKDFTNIEIETVNERWTGQILDGIVIAAVDSMEVRKEVFDSHYKKAFNTKLIIDPRMSAETALLYAYKPLAVEEGQRYSSSLYSDSEAVQERCTAKSTMFCSLGISSAICATVKNFTVDNKYPKSKMFDMLNLDIG